MTLIEGENMAGYFVIVNKSLCRSYEMYRQRETPATYFYYFKLLVKSHYKILFMFLLIKFNHLSDIL